MKRRQPKPIGTTGQRAAILSLLEDDDPATRGLVLAQIASLGSQGVPEIEALIRAAPPGPRALLEAVLRRALEGRLDAGLRDRCSSIETLAEFEEFCWRLAEWTRPGARVAEARALIEEWGRTVAARLSPRLADEARAGVLASVLARQEGLGGNKTDYYDPDNSLIDAVVLSRRGLPLTLTAIYMFVGARAGLPVSAIALQAHVLARIGSVHFDPFEGGRAVEAPRSNPVAGGPDGAGRTQLLAPSSYGMMAWRMVLNLAHAFERGEDFAQLHRLAKVFEWLRLSRSAGDPRSVGTGAP